MLGWEEICLRQSHRDMTKALLAMPELLRDVLLTSPAAAVLRVAGVALDAESRAVAAHICCNLKGTGLIFVK